jgi:hypothetical protein
MRLFKEQKVSTSPVELLHFEGELRKVLPNLSKPVVGVLAQMCFGMLQTRQAGRSQVTAFLASYLQQKVNAVEQRLYQWCRHKDPSGCRSKQPRNWEVSQCFGPLLAWIVKLWRSPQLGLALDATMLQDRFLVLTISVVFRQTGIPVAWKVLVANQKHPWGPGWLELLVLIAPVVPKTWRVIVLTDRGLCSKSLFDGFVAHGWHPVMRVNGQGCFRPDTTNPPPRQQNGRYLADFAAHTKTPCAFTGKAFSGKNQITCTLLCWHQSGCKDPWIILTDLPPDACDIAWYGMRCWCEQGFKCFKRGAWQWHHTRMTDPQRAERLWLAIAVATLWCVAVGAQVEDDPLQAAYYSNWLKGSGKNIDTPRQLRLLNIGLLHMISALVRSHPLPRPFRLFPTPWPVTTLCPPIS